MFSSVVYCLSWNSLRSLQPPTLQERLPFEHMIESKDKANLFGSTGKPMNLVLTIYKLWGWCGSLLPICFTFFRNPPSKDYQREWRMPFWYLPQIRSPVLSGQPAWRWGDVPPECWNCSFLDPANEYCFYMGIILLWSNSNSIHRFCHQNSVIKFHTTGLSCQTCCLSNPGHADLGRPASRDLADQAQGSSAAELANIVTWRRQSWVSGHVCVHFQGIWTCWWCGGWFSGRVNIL